MVVHWQVSVELNVGVPPPLQVRRDLMVMIIIKLKKSKCSICAILKYCAFHKTFTRYAKILLG